MNSTDLNRGVAFAALTAEPDQTLGMRAGRLCWRSPSLLVVLSFLLFAGVSLFTRASHAGELDLRASRVYIKVGKTGFGHDHAIVGKLRSGAVQIGKTADAGHMVFDMTSFDADTLEARRYIGLSGTTDPKTQKEVNTNMLGPDVLDTKKYPTATFAIVSAVPIGKKSRDGWPIVEMKGDFTLHGVKQPLEVSAELIEREGSTVLRGGFPLKQTSHGIKPFSKAFGAVGVADELTVFGEMVFAAGATTSRRPTERR